MSKIKSLAVKDLKLDLNNYRTVPQKTEEASVHALISLDPDYFWALTESLLKDGWHGTENVLILDAGGKKIVKEGNRRIGAIKLILGKFNLDNFNIPAGLRTQMEGASAEWKKRNAEVPCNIFGAAEAKQVKDLVGLTHAKGEKAGRLDWNTVARARFNRDDGGSEPALDLLETYLKTDETIDASQRERWSGEYPLSVLVEALKKLTTRLGLADSKAVAAEYPGNATHLKAFENLLHDIGVGTVTFPKMRDQSDDLLQRYGFPAPPPPPAPAPAPTTPPSGGTPPPAGAPGGGGVPTPKPAGKPVKTLGLRDPKSVRRELKKFIPKGKSSSKVVDLLNEARQLDVEDTPIAFCFLFRSMLDISVGDYCSAKSLPTVVVKKGKAKDKSLAELLIDAGQHIMGATSDRALTSAMKTAISEVKSHHSVLSVPTMNALVHSGTATITPAHVIAGFHKLLPLLVTLNK